MKNADVVSLLSLQIKLKSRNIKLQRRTCDDAKRLYYFTDELTEVACKAHTQKL